MKSTEAAATKKTVQDVMLGAQWHASRRQLPTESPEWLTDNGSAYRASGTRAFARLLTGACTTAVRNSKATA
ncbi:hypothetical protein KCP73_26120 [Salmonella enterica subsp. enterica]|nr:hypothetical protein KCP73_26120 [Salmonella enterica subsp. enterica]